MEEFFDVIIIGAGPAGLTAAIYARRAELKTLLIERNMPGGQILSTYEVDNYPGLPGLSGTELGAKMSEHADKFALRRISAEVRKIDFKEGCHRVETDTGDFIGKTIILATGNSAKKLGIIGEEELAGAGVSYCATCDGAFYKGCDVAVIGGGDVAVEDAIFLARGCRRVYLIHRRDELRATRTLQTVAKNTSNIEFVWDSVATEILGCDEGEVTGVEIENVKSHEKRLLDVAGVFIAVGHTPNTSYLGGIEMDERGYVVADESCITSVPGVFAAGDIRTKRLRQVSTAVGDGANAVYSAEEYITQKRISFS